MQARYAVQVVFTHKGKDYPSTWIYTDSLGEAIEFRDESAFKTQIVSLEHVAVERSTEQ